MSASPTRRWLVRTRERERRMVEERERRRSALKMEEEYLMLVRARTDEKIKKQKREEA